MASTGSEFVRKALATYEARRRELATLSFVALMVTVCVALGLHQRGIAATRTELVLDCHYAGTGAHEHGEGCYDAAGNLVCPLEEREYHVHDDSCYAERRELACGMDEHTHGEGCYDADGSLVCDVAEHVHTDACYDVTRELACGKEETTETHTHGPGCFREVTVEDGEPEVQGAGEDPAADPGAGEPADPAAGAEPGAADGAAEPAAMPEQAFAHEFKDPDGNLVLRVDVKAPEGTLPEGTTMQAEWVDPSTLSKKQRKAVDKALAEKADGKVIEQQAVDITFLDKEGSKVEPSGKVTVTFTSGLIDTDDQTTVVHIDDLTEKQLEAQEEALREGKSAEEAEPRRKAEAIDSLTDEELRRRDASVSGDQLAFDADQFSTYVLSVTSQRRELRCEGEDVAVTVDVPAKAGVPAGATLQVTEIGEGTVEHEAYQEAAAETMGVDEERDVELARFFDIRIVDASGQEVQPSEAMQVSIELANAPQDAVDVDVVQFDGETGTPELVDATENAGTSTFEAEGVNVYGVVYTVDFHWEVDGKTYEFSIPGGGYVTLQQLVEVLGIAKTDADNESNEAVEVLEQGERTLANVTIGDSTREFVADVESVEFSHPELAWIGKAEVETTVKSLKETNGLECQYSAELTDEQIAEINAQTVEANDWALISIQPFTSEEDLTVTMKNGDQFVVKVTDAADDPVGQDPYGISGKSFAIVNDRHESGNNWYALKDYIDSTKDTRGYYMSATNSSHTVGSNGSHYSSAGDTLWQFEYVRTIQNGTAAGNYYRISTTNGYLFIDPAVSKKTDMPSNTVHQYERALRLEQNPGDESENDGTLIRIIANNDGTYYLQNRNGLSLWDYNNNQFWLSTVDEEISNNAQQDGKMYLTLLPEPAHVTVHYVKRDGTPVPVTYNGSSNQIRPGEGTGTFVIPYNINSDNIDLSDKQTFNWGNYTYANTHLAGDGGEGDGRNLTYEGLLIDSTLKPSNNSLSISSDSGETYGGSSWNYYGEGYPAANDRIYRGNKNYGNLQDYDLSWTFFARTFLGSNETKPKVYTGSTNKDIYVVLDPLPENVEEGESQLPTLDPDNPKLTKEMEDNGDGTYTLSLKVDAHAASASKTKKANVLFVVDTSSSMRSVTEKDGFNRDWKTRITDTHDAVLDLGNRFLAYNQNHPNAVELSMITFDGSVDDRTNPLWTTNEDEFHASVNYLTYTYLHTGTDWEDAMKRALKIVQDKKQVDDDPIFVVFFTDGEPSQYTNFSGKNKNTHNNPLWPNYSDIQSSENVSNGYPNFYSYFLSREGSKDEMRAIVDEDVRLYGIFAYNPTEQTYPTTGENGADLLHNAIRYGYNTNKDLNNKLFFNTNSTQELQRAFDAIFNSITETVGFAPVVVKDGIATAVTSSTVVDGDVSAFTYTIRDNRGALAYQVTVAPNGVPEGQTVDVGTPIFKIAGSDTPVVGEIKAVTVKKIITDQDGHPIRDDNGKIQTEDTNVYAYYYKDADNKEYIMPISKAEENIVWDLSPLGVLQDGYSYEVSFVVWPNQESYDLVADLNNGLKKDLEATADWTSCPILTDSQGRQYQQGGIPDYGYISKYVDTGIYSAMSNTSQNIEFYKVDEKIVNGQMTTEYDGPYNPTVDPPGPMPLEDSQSRIEKLWNVERDPGILAQYLYNADGTSKKFKVEFDVFQGSKTTPYLTVSLGWDDAANNGQGAYVWAPDSPLTSVTYMDHVYEIGTRWAEDFCIATGIMLSEGQMEEHGLNKNSYPYGTYTVNGETETYYILDTGHDYTIKEHQTGTIGYEFDFESPVYHPMLVDGTLQSVTFSTDGDNVSITSMTDAEVGLSSLLIKNTLRGYINLDKVVVDAEENTISDDDTEFEYTITLNSSTNPGPFEGDHIPWYGIEGLFYHDMVDGVIGKYYQATEISPATETTPARWRLIDEDRNTYTFSSNTFHTDIAGAQTITTDGSNPLTITLYGNQMSASNEGKTATATLKINQNQTLSIANVPAGTQYTITETPQAGYTLIEMVKEIKTDPDAENAESSQTFTEDDLNGGTVTGTIVANRDNHIVYKNQFKPGALKLTKVVQIDGATPASDKYGLVDGKYIFTVENAEGNAFELKKYVQIKVQNGVATSYKIADTEAALEEAPSVDGEWAILTNLAAGDYVITETAERNGLLLTNIARGDANATAVDLDNSCVTVHVTSQDTAAAQPDAKATFTNNYYNNDGPDRIALDIQKTFYGLVSASDLPDNFRVVICYSVPGRDDPIEIELKKGQNETITTADGEHIKINGTTNGFTLSWHITNIPSEATDFKIKESNYDTLTGYNFTAATLDNIDIKETAGNWHPMSIVAPEAVLSKVTDERRTSDNNQNVEFTLEDGDILLSKLTANQGTLVISKTSLNKLERDAVVAAWPDKGGFKTPPRYFSIEEHSSGFKYGGKTVTFTVREDGKTIVTFSHNASAQEDVFAVTYDGHPSLNNATLTNTYVQKKVTLELIKVDSTNMTTPLENAQFTLKKLDPDGTGDYLQGSDAVEKTSGDTDAEGKATITGITDGYYEISETKIPAGYILSDNGVFFIKVVNGAISRIAKTVDDPMTTETNEGKVRNWPLVTDNTGSIQFVNTQSATPDDPDTENVNESTEATTTYKVGNTPGAALPNSGGSGTSSLYIIGCLMVMLTAAGIAMRQKWSQSGKRV